MVITSFLLGLIEIVTGEALGALGVFEASRPLAGHVDGALDPRTDEVRIFTFRRVSVSDDGLLFAVVDWHNDEGDAVLSETIILEDFIEWVEAA
jgi:hypothetical protein